MKALSKLPIVFLPIVLLLCIGCDKFKGDTGPAGPSITGDLIGFSYLYDVDGNHVLDNSGIAVSVDGTNISATSDSSGRWMLPGLNTGTYTIAISKEGYGTEKIIGYPFVGGGQAYFGKLSLHQIPSFSITELSATTSLGFVNISGTLSGSLPANHRNP